MKFHEIRFPDDITFGAEGGPERKSEIVRLANGMDHVNLPWSNSVRKYNVSTGMKTLDNLSEVVEFFEFCNGAEYGFRWKDWADYKSCLPSQSLSAFDQLIGVGDGATTMFQLQKQYGQGQAAYMRKIAKPVQGTVLISMDGNSQVDATDMTVDHLAGTVVFETPPNHGNIVTAGFEFDVPVRFDLSDLFISLTHFEAGEIHNIEVRELII